MYMYKYSSDIEYPLVASMVNFPPLYFQAASIVIQTEKSSKAVEPIGVYNQQDNDSYMYLNVVVTIFLGDSGFPKVHTKASYEAIVMITHCILNSPHQGIYM